MGKITRIFLLATFFFVALQSCEMKEPIDDDIEGMWRLESFETVADGTVHECDRIYYSITRYVVEVSEKQGPHGYGTYIGRFGYLNGRTQVVMKDFKERAATSDNGVDATVDDLLPFGMNSVNTTFDVVVADGDNLVLRSDYATLRLTKF